MPESAQSIILFDGVCNLCNGAVQFIIERDATAQFHFAALQSDFGQQILQQFKLPTAALDTIILIENGQAFTRSTAALRIARRLDNVGWRVFGKVALAIVPRFVRDFFYNLIARNRYRMFGKQTECWLPTPELRARFLN